MDSCWAVRAEQTPGGSWRLPADQFTHEHIRPDETMEAEGSTAGANRRLPGAFG